MTKHCVRWQDFPATASPNGALRRSIEGSGASLVMVTVPAGLTAHRHSHSCEQFVQVISGSGALTTEQGEVAFMAASVFHFPAGTWHEARFDTDTCLIETNLAA